MTIKVPYGRESIPVEVPEKNVLAVVEPNEVPEREGSMVIAEALARPIKLPHLEAFLAGAKSVLVIVNDATRPTPTETMLDSLLPKLAGLDVRFLVATGAHRAPNQDEWRQIFGRHYAELEGKLYAHDSRDDSKMIFLGRTRNGTEIILNKMIFESDRIIVTGSVEPHYFAGYTGGRKAFFPGCAAFRTIEQNHRRALSSDARSLKIGGNPVSEDMTDALSLVTAPVFSLMAVLDRHQHIAYAFAGGIEPAFDAAVEKARAIFAVPIPQRADIVVSAVRYPMDIDLYQSQKAIDNGTLAVKEGGILILVSTCRDGTGDKAYIDLLSSTRSPREALEKIDKGYRLGYHKAAKMALASIHSRLWGVTDLPQETLRGVFIEPKSGVAEALHEALDLMGPDSRVLFLLDGSVTVPLLPGCA
jgi:nickel-dependent lactate racemase